MIPMHQGELNELQRISISDMQDEVSISIPGASVSDGSGGRIPGPPTITATVARMRGVGQGTERVIADKMQIEQPYAFDLPSTVNVPTNATIIMGDREFEVRAVSKVGSFVLIQTVIVNELIESE